MNVVVMPTYNGSRYIGAQIQSILSQLDEGDLLLISDDGSTDDTLNIIKSFGAKNIFLFQRTKSSVVYDDSYCYTTDNINYLLSKVPSCDCVFFADQDDVWLPNKVKLFKDAFYNFDCVLSDCTYVDQSLKILHKSKFQNDGFNLSLISVLMKNPYLGASMAIKYDLLKKIIPIPPHLPHDMWIGVMSNFYGSINVLKTQTMLYRRHEEALTYTLVQHGNFAGKKRSLYKKIRARVIFVLRIFQRLVLQA